MELLIILVFNVINGIFALSEIALVSVRKQRMVHLAEQGSARARTVLELLKNPEGFLSAVQIGITLIGIVSGVYGGATLTDNFRPYLEQLEWLRPYAGQVAYVAVVALITYLSIVIGELIPKTLAMKYAEPVALSIAGFIQVFTRFASPFVWLLTATTNLVFRVFGIQPTPEEKITEEELRYVIKTAGKQGLLDEDESEIHDNVLSFSALRAKGMMTHRLEVEWVDATDPLETIEAQLRDSQRTLLPVCSESYDHVLGYLSVRDFFARRAEPGFQLRSIVREPVFVPENQYAIDTLRQFKKQRCYFGIVVDEFGAFEGIITLFDISEALVGDLPEDNNEPADILRRDDGTLLVGGHVLVGDLNRYMESDFIPENNVLYNTIAGFILHYLERIPDVGEHLEYGGRRLEILDKDGARIDKVLVGVPGEA
jgi:putative hemolysin